LTCDVERPAAKLFKLSAELRGFAFGHCNPPNLVAQRQVDGFDVFMFEQIVL
jgi:hypothetical protein